MSDVPAQNLNYFLSWAINNLRDPSTRSWIFLNPTSIGDTWLVCALAKAFREQHNGEAITMVVKPSQTALAEMYAHNYLKIITMDTGSLHSVCEKIHTLTTFALDIPIVAHPFWHGTGRDFELQSLFSIPGRGGVQFADIFRMLLRLPWTAPIERPVIRQEWRDEAKAYADSIGMEVGNSVILMPDNNTNRPMPDSFWQELATALVRNGKKVFTNMVGTNSAPRQVPFAGSTGINITLQHVIPLVELAGRYITMSNGLAAMLTGCGVNSRFTNVILKDKVGNESSINYLTIRDPLPYCSFKYNGLAEIPENISEYILEEGADWSQMIIDIANDDPRSAYKW